MSTHLNPHHLLSDWPERQSPEPTCDSSCIRCGLESDGLPYCYECLPDGLKEKNEEIRDLRHRLTAIHQLCERIQTIGSEPPAKGGSHSAQFGRTLALVRDIDRETRFLWGR